LSCRSDLDRLSLTIPELLSVTSVAPRWIAAGEPPSGEITGISTDSRTTKTGELFFALAGDKFDGHNFIGLAFENNATAAVVSEKWLEGQGKAFAGKSLIVVSDTLAAYQEFARYYASKFDMTKIAITGSSGKTTAKEFIYSALASDFNVLRNKKSFNNHIGVPATLYEMRKEHDVLLSEMATNHFGELERLSYLVEPDMCVLINVGYAHLEFFKSLEGVKKAKMEILSHAKREGTVVYNYDDPVLRDISYPLARSVSYGMEEGAHLRGKLIDCDALARYRFACKGVQVRLPIPGRHNVSNALAAFCVALELGLSPAHIRDGLESLVAVDQRMQVLRIRNFVLINDSYNSNPDSCLAALRTLADIQAEGNGRKIAVLGDMLELGDYAEKEHARLAEHIRDFHIDALFLFGKHTLATSAEAQRIDYKSVRHFSDKEDLHRAVREYVTDFDVVLVKGSRGMKMETVVQSLAENAGRS
jgi:UDP-N-acetylmuramoyl-tripeptide--D-alanyl-D-alanine ligase